MALASGGAAFAGMAALARLADTTTGGTPPSTQPAAGSGQGPEWGEAAPIGLLIILLMGGALFLLMKSMNRNLRRVPESFAEPVGKAAPAVAELTGSALEPAGGSATSNRTDHVSDSGPNREAPDGGTTTEDASDDDRRAPAP